MSAVWFVARNGESLGPYTSDALRQMAESGELQHTDLLWKDGMKDWRPAGDSKGLFPKPQTCANVTAAGGMDPQASSSAKKPPSVGTCQ
jgi:hypothetical protein